jgi:putative multiple sugar transport system substrate-binding protein
MRKSTVAKLFLSTLLAASFAGAVAANADTIGITLPTQDLARCLKDQEYLTEDLNALGYDVDVQFAMGDAAKQASIVENMLLNGCVGIIISPWDGGALTNAVQACKDAGVPVLAYDANILNTDYIDYFVTDDLVGIGRLQAQFIVDKLGVEESDESFNIELFGGDYGDASAKYFWDGAMEVLTPYIESGKLVVVSEQTDYNTCAVPEWDAAKAQSRMDTLLSTYYTDKRLDAALTQNDNLAAGAIASLKSVGYGTEDMPMPVLTGMDCTISALKYIHAGDQSMTIYKDIRALAENASMIIDCLVRGEEPDFSGVETTTYDNGVKEVIATKVPAMVLTDDKIQELVFDTGYYTEEEVGLE